MLAELDIVQPAERMTVDIAAVAVAAAEAEHANWKVEIGHVAAAAAYRPAESSSSAAEVHPEAASAAQVVVDSLVEARNLPAASQEVEEILEAERQARDDEGLNHANCPTDHQAPALRRVHDHKECCSRRSERASAAA